MPHTKIEPVCLREGEAADYMNVTRRWLQERRRDGRGPRYSLLGTQRTLRYLKADLDAFIEEHARHSTAENSF